MPLRHDVTPCEWTRWLEADHGVGGVVPGACSLPGPTLACVAGNGGVRSPRESLRTSVPSGSYGRGADRTGELREPSLMPREVQLRDGLLQRSVGTGRCD